MSIQDDPIVYDALEQDDDGHVIGSLYTRYKDGYDVTAHVTSYELGKRYSADMNHVPFVVVREPNGSTAAEPHVRDSTNAQTAIERARGAARTAFNNIDQLTE